MIKVIITLLIFNIFYIIELNAEEIILNEEFKIGNIAYVDQSLYPSVVDDEDYIKNIYKLNDTTNLNCSLIKGDNIITESMAIYSDDYYLSQTCLNDGSEVYFTNEDEKLNFENNILNNKYSYNNNIDTRYNKSPLSTKYIDNTSSSKMGKYNEKQSIIISCPSKYNVYKNKYLRYYITNICSIKSNKKYIIDDNLDIKNRYHKLYIYTKDNCSDKTGISYESSVVSNSYTSLDISNLPLGSCLYEGYFLYD